MPARLSPESWLSEHFGSFAVPAWKLLPSIETATKDQTYSFRTLRTISESQSAVVRRSDSGFGDSGAGQTGVGRSYEAKPK